MNTQVPYQNVSAYLGGQIVYLVQTYISIEYSCIRITRRNDSIEIAIKTIC